MATYLKIPLLGETTDQLLNVELDGRPFVLRVLWNERFGYFCLSIFEADETPILTNVKLVKNYPTTLRFKDDRLPFGDFYLIQEKGNADRPGYSDLATDFSLYYIEPDTVATPQQVAPTTPVTLIGTRWDSGVTTWDAGGTLWGQ